MSQRTREARGPEDTLPPGGGLPPDGALPLPVAGPAADPDCGVRVPGRAALIPIGVGRAGRRVLGRLDARLGGTEPHQGGHSH
ncbi:hypothetical protein [Streptomyces sp. NPDC058092]|uniref:hypothetical protein n=1 Tax=Streptomyces sp. NPDC058092 TaxID=3346336 RepID=UPI0036F0A8B0